MSRLFSVIIPCYNVEKYIDDCLNSILNQTIGIDNIEIILVDDCSRDNTVEKLLEYEKKYPENILVVLAEKNGKQGTARNIGMAYASGEYLCFIDSDDIVSIYMFEVLSNIIENNDVDVVQFRYQPFNSDIVLVDHSPDWDELDRKTKYFDYGLNRKKYLLNSDILNESCVQKIYKRQMIQNIGNRYAEGVAYEEPLFTYPIKYYVNRICVLEHSLYFYRKNDEGTTFGYMTNPETILDHLNVQLELRDFMLNCESIKGYDNELDLYFMHAFYVEPFYFFKKRGWQFPVALFSYMKAKVKEYCPNYSLNPYFEDTSLVDEKKLVALLEYDLEDFQMQEKIDSIMGKI